MHAFYLHAPPPSHLLAFYFSVTELHNSVLLKIEIKHYGTFFIGVDTVVFKH